MPLTHNGRLKKWGAIANRKQKHTANTLLRSGISREIERNGRLASVVIEG
jgi:hypothetical protein